MLKKNSTRIRWVDQLRGIAIVLMVIFHFCYDLRFFGWVTWDVPNGDGWWQFRYSILTIFIFTMGMSLSLAHQNQFNRKKFIRRSIQLAIAAGLVTLMSLFMFPSAWIYFGILHFLFAASLICILFIKQALFAFFIGLAIVISYCLGLVDSKVPFSFIDAYLPNNTEDFVPLFPWLGVCLMGVAAGQYLPLQKIERALPTLPKGLGFLGQHGLIIYLVHQPILFAVLTPLSLLQNGNG